MQRGPRLRRGAISRLAGSALADRRHVFEEPLTTIGLLITIARLAFAVRLGLGVGGHRRPALTGPGVVDHLPQACPGRGRGASRLVRVVSPCASRLEGDLPATLLTRGLATGAFP
jgi:hypothetical protein